MSIQSLIDTTIFSVEELTSLDKLNSLFSPELQPFVYVACHGTIAYGAPEQ